MRASTATPSCSSAVAVKRPTHPVLATISAASGGPATQATDSSVRRTLTIIDGPRETARPYAKICGSNDDVIATKTTDVPSRSQ